MVRRASSKALFTRLAACFSTWFQNHVILTISSNRSQIYFTLGFGLWKTLGERSRFGCRTRMRAVATQASTMFRERIRQQTYGQSLLCCFCATWNFLLLTKT
jgi:hypothetical protein